MRLPDDQRLTYQISIAVLKTAPRDKYLAYSSGRTYGVRYSAAGKKAIGKRIRDTLGLLLFNISDHIQALPDSAQQLKTALCLPFSLSPTLLLSGDIPPPITYIEAT